MKKTIVVIAFFMVLMTLEVTLAVETNYTDTLQVPVSSQSISNPAGYTLKVNESCILTSATKFASSTPTRAILYNYAHNVVLQNVSFTGNTAIFNTVLNASTVYLLVAHSSGASYTNYYGNNVSFFPHLFSSKNTIWTINESLTADNAEFSSFSTTYTQAFTSINCSVDVFTDPVLTLRLGNLVNTSLISGYCINATGTNTSQNKCNTTGTNIHFNTTGTYNITFYNITGGHANPTYFNTTLRNYAWTSSQTVQANTSQGLLNVSAYRLFLNTGITTFNVTNQNAVNQTTSTTMLVPANNGSQSVKFDVAGNYSINATCTGTIFQVVSCTITGVYDAILTINATNISTPVQNFIINITNTTLGLNDQQNTTNGPGIVYQVLQGYSYILEFTKLGLNDDNTTLLVNNNSASYMFFVAPSPAINVSIYDEITNNLITGENFTLEVINELYSENYTITNGLRYINLTAVAGNTIFRYYSLSYEQRDYILDINPGSIYQLRLYDINLSLSQIVTATVYDTGNSLIENATITLLRYFVDCNCYRTVQMTSTGGDGTGLFYVQALDGHYKWSVAYLGTVYFLSTTSEQINTDTRTFVIDLGQNFYSGFESLASLGYAVTYNTTSKTLSYIYTDTGSLVTGGCLQVRYLSGVEYVTLEYDCVVGSSGSVFITLPSPNTTTYLYSAYVNTSNTYTPLLTVDTGSVQSPPLYNFGSTGIFLAVGILVVLVTIFSFSAVATVLISVVGVIIIASMGIMTFTTSFITGISVLILGISLFLMRS